MKCFYHNDMDGRSSAYVVADFHNNFYREDFYEVHYNMDLTPYLDKINDGELVYFVDYSFKDNTKDIIAKLQKKNCNIHWIDHHTSSFEICKKYDYMNTIKGIREEGLSGAVLTYMYLYDVSYIEVPYYLKLVSDYDCWKYKYDPDTTYFKIGVETEKYDFNDNIWKRLSKENYTKEIINKGKIVKDYIDVDNLNYRDSYAYESELCGYKCLVVNRKSNSWIFGDKYYQYPLVVVWVFNGVNYSYSLYSNDKSIDCSKIAEQFGGGGHKGASGFTTDELILKRC